MLMVISDVLGASDHSEVTMQALLDICFAFDTVDHSILLQRLHDTYGLRGARLA